MYINILDHNLKVCDRDVGSLPLHFGSEGVLEALHLKKAVSLRECLVKGVLDETQGKLFALEED